MKKLLIMLFALGVVAGASAQRVHISGGYHYNRPRVAVVYGAFAPLYPYYGFGYSPFGYPYYNPYGYNRPSKLTLQIEDIKNDYRDKIWSVKHNKSLSKHQRKDIIRELKTQRDQLINDKKRNYYKN